MNITLPPCHHTHPGYIFQIYENCYCHGNDSKRGDWCTSHIYIPQYPWITAFPGPREACALNTQLFFNKTTSISSQQGTDYGWHCWGLIGPDRAPTIEIIGRQIWCELGKWVVILMVLRDERMKEMTQGGQGPWARRSLRTRGHVYRLNLSLSHAHPHIPTSRHWRAPNQCNRPLYR